MSLRRAMVGVNSSAALNAVDDIPVLLVISPLVGEAFSRLG